MSAPAPRLQGFAVERLLGRGGSGEVWSGRVVDSGDRVALKFLHRACERAGIEAALLETLDHPHLVRMIGMVATDGAPVLVLDLAEGGSLARLLDARGSLAVGEVVTALSPIAMALAHAHLHGVVHADVTPGNILFTAGGLPLLADLGIARLTGDAEWLDGTRCTPQYVDPSVANGSVPSAASDVFMLAAVAVHALTGSPIWAGASAEQALAAAEAADLAGLQERLRAAAVPEAVVAVLTRATDLDPLRRGSAAAFGLDLRAAAEPVPVDLRAGRVDSRAASLDAADGKRPAAAPPAEPRVGARHAAPAGSGQVFTRIAGARPRPALPASTGRSWRDRLAQPGRPEQQRSLRRPGGHGRRWTALAAFVVAVLCGAGVAWAVTGGDTHAARPLAQPTADVSLPVLPVAVSSGADPSSAPPASSAQPSTPTAPTLSSAQAAGVLMQLDSLRQQAFAKRIPLLLTGVYPTGALLSRDTALLQRLVPAGCGLDGVQTSYGQVRVISSDPHAVIVSANVALQESYLVCGGRISARAPGAPAQLLRISLVYRGNGYLIGDIARA